MLGYPKWTSSCLDSADEDGTSEEGPPFQAGIENARANSESFAWNTDVEAQF
jgi:hypothetical protein